MWGLENLHEAYRRGYAILTEGITDAIAVRNLGDRYSVTFANCGTHGSSLIMRQLNRCRYGIIRLPDRDEAGQRAVKKWECNRYITLNTFVAYKDVDEMIKKAGNDAPQVLRIGNSETLNDLYNKYAYAYKITPNKPLLKELTELYKELLNEELNN